MYLVDRAVSFTVGSAACVAPVPSDTALEEPTAAITCVDAVVFPRGTITADFAWNV